MEKLYLLALRILFDYKQDKKKKKKKNEEEEEREKRGSGRINWEKKNNEKNQSNSKFKIYENGKPFRRKMKRKGEKMF